MLPLKIHILIYDDFYRRRPQDVKNSLPDEIVFGDPYALRTLYYIMHNDCLSCLRYEPHKHS